MPAAQAPEVYRPVSMLAIGGLTASALYALLVSAGGLAAFAAARGRTTLLVLAVLGPLLGVLGAALMREQRPRRLLAVAGLALGGTLAALALFSLVAFSGSNPWLVPGWTLVLPLLGGLVSWLARARIQKSEGTLSGTALTTWGLGLSLVFGLTYAAFLTATLYAVRDQQGNEIARAYLREIQNGNLPRAFLLTLPPSARPAEGPRLRDDIQVRFNTAKGPEPGPYSRFAQRDYVRLLQMAGEQAQVELKNADWKYEQNAYSVTLVYQVTASLAKFQVSVTARGQEAAGPKGGGRQWHVVGDSTGMLPSSLNLEAEAKDVLGSAVPFARTWAEQLNQGQFDEAYRNTQPPAQRKAPAPKKAGLDRTGLGALAGPLAPGPLAVADAGLAQVGRRAFFLGGLVRVDGKYTGEPLWMDHDARPDLAPEKKEARRAEAVEEARKLFRPDLAGRPQLVLLGSEIPFWKREGDKLRLWLTGQLAGGDPRAAPRFLLEVRVVLEADASAEGAPLSWRVVALELVRGEGVEGPPRRGPP
jgi:hypothetical protein